MKTSRLYTLGLPLALFVTLTALFLIASGSRPFWVDEIIGFEAIDISFLQLFTEGPRGQCSRAPLFYALNKLFFPSGAPLDTLFYRELLRLPSAMSAALVIAFIIRIFKQWPIVALFVAAHLFQEALFINHATEARPYALWMLLTFLFTDLFVRKFFDANPETKDYVLFAILCFILALLTTGSIFIFVGLFAWYFIFQKKQFIKIAAYLSPAMLVSIYYASTATCENHASGGGAIYNVIHTVKSGDYTLIKAVVKLLFSPKSLYELPINLGYFCFVILLVTKAKTFRVQGKKVLSLLVIFVIAAALTGLAIAYRNYYFVPRLFLFLFVARAFIVGIIFSTISDYLKHKKFKGLSLQPIFLALLVVLTAASGIRGIFNYPVSEVKDLLLSFLSGL